MTRRAPWQWRGRPRAVLTAVVSLSAVLSSAWGAAGTAQAATADRPVPATGVLARVHTAGRVQDAGEAVRYSWPGVYFEGIVRAPASASCSTTRPPTTTSGSTEPPLPRWVAPGDTTHWINGLSDTTHTVRLVKRTDSPGDTSTFGGFLAAPGGAVLSRPAARDRQIEFIGDS
ncbi:hypothetical protein LT493_23425 [Streptomyces tricolor]|nr:hypothetical protein [Streptomyces tricolor]